MKRYYKRIIEKEIKLSLGSMGAILIEGPKWCGKTTTALQYANSSLKMQDPLSSINNQLIAKTAPNLLLEGEKPRVIDEWQTASILWDTVRADVDRSGEKGQYILTGSTTPIKDKTMHTGTGRIARIKMYPMSLYESEDSIGSISLSSLFKGEPVIPTKSRKSIHDIAYLICRGGWPQHIGLDEEKAMYSMRQYVRSIYNNDINEMGEAKTDPKRVETFLKSYSRNLQTLASNQTLIGDIESNDVGITMPTLYSYKSKLEALFIIDEVSSWRPNIRSKESMRAQDKRSLVDPSIATAVLNIGPEMLLKDFEMFGFLFEALCTRDLRIYASSLGADVLYYQDKSGLECDAVIRLPNGDVGLIEIKLGGKLEEVAAANLLKLEEMLTKVNIVPSFKMILTAGEFAYTREDGVIVVPLATLKN